MDAALRYAIAWTATISIVLVPWTMISLYVLSRAQGGGTDGLWSYLLPTVPVGVVLVVGAWLWSFRWGGRVASMVAGGALVLFYTAWLIFSTSQTIQSLLVFGVPLVLHAIVLVRGRRPATRQAFALRRDRRRD